MVTHKLYLYVLLLFVVVTTPPFKICHLVKGNFLVYIVNDLYHFTNVYKKNTGKVKAFSSVNEYGCRPAASRGESTK